MCFDVVALTMPGLLFLEQGKPILSLCKYSINLDQF